MKEFEVTVEAQAYGQVFEVVVSVYAEDESEAEEIAEQKVYDSTIVNATNVEEIEEE